jgi:NitT/TauT family transport system permease protein/taurine transport system permease protein
MTTLTAAAPLRQDLRRVAPALVPPLVGLAIWWAVTTLGLVPGYVLPPPQDVVRALANLFLSGGVIGHAINSLGRLALGFVIGAVLGIGAGILVGRSARAEQLLRAPLTFFQAIGGIAWIPLAIVWFGLGTPAVVFVVANITFFVLLQSTILGVRGVSRTMEDMVRTLGGSRTAVLREVVIPGAFVSALVGMRVGLAYGWRALIGAELIVASNGLGFLTLQASSRMETATVIAAIAVIGVLWLAIDHTLIDALERRTVRRWGLIQTRTQGRGGGRR